MRGVIMKKGIRDGTLKEADIQAFLDKLTGRDLQAEHDGMVRDEVVAMVGQEEFVADENNPFSLGPSTDSKRQSDMLAALSKIEAGDSDAMIPSARLDLQQLGGTADIHLVWGNQKKGLLHIGQKRGKRVVAGVLEAVIRGKVSRHSSAKKTVSLDYNGFTAILIA
jgi:hypothetical protein